LREDVQNWLQGWFRSRGKLIGQGYLQVDTDYFEAGWLTSMEVVEFVVEIEAHFDVQFTDQDMQDPRFVTIAGLTELILERSAETKQSR
jgi:acyl carrier protein